MSQVRAAAAGAGLVADDPVRGHAGAQPLAAGLVGVEPAPGAGHARRAESASPKRIFCMSPSMAAGVVVSRGSPGRASLSAGSLRSSRVCVSPSARGSASGRPGRRSSRASGSPAVLSLRVTAASQSLGQRQPVPADVLSGDGRCSHQVALAEDDAAVQPLLLLVDAASIAAAARNLKVLHIGKRSSSRWPARRPLPVSRMHDAEAAAAGLLDLGAAP